MPRPLLARAVFFAALVAMPGDTGATEPTATEAQPCADAPLLMEGSCREAYELLTKDMAAEPDLVVFATARKDGWRFRYSRTGVDGDCTVADVLVLPQGRPLRLHVIAEDDIHEWTVPAIGIDADAVPGRISEVPVTTTKIGTFEGEGAVVRILADADFAAWERDTLATDCE